MCNLCGVATVLAGLAVPAAVLGRGTPAGTVIANTAIATFTVGNEVATAASNTSRVTVDQVTGVALTPLVAGPLAIGPAGAVLAFQVTNIGNGTDTFALTATTAIAGNAFTPTLQTLALDANGNGIYDAALDTALANGSASPGLAPDASLRVFVVVGAPQGLADTQAAQVRLAAASQTAAGTPGTLFAGKGNGGVDAIVGASGGNAAALEGLLASLASVTLTKTATIADPYGGANPLAGAIVTYAITAHTAGTGSAEALQITDPIPAGTSYVAGSLTLNGASLTDTSDGDAGQASAGGITVALGNVPGGAPDRTITFKVRIN